MKQTQAYHNFFVFVVLILVIIFIIIGFRHLVVILQFGQQPRYTTTFQEILQSRKEISTKDSLRCDKHIECNLT